MCNNEKRANHLLACDQPFLDGGGFQRIRTAVAAFAELCLTARPGNLNVLSLKTFVSELSPKRLIVESGCKETGFFWKLASTLPDDFYFSEFSSPTDQNPLLLNIQRIFA